MAVKNRCWCEDLRKRITTTTVGLEECKLQRPFKAVQGVENSNRKMGRTGDFNWPQPGACGMMMGSLLGQG